MASDIRSCKISRNPLSSTNSERQRREKGEEIKYSVEVKREKRERRRKKKIEGKRRERKAAMKITEEKEE